MLNLALPDVKILLDYSDIFDTTQEYCYVNYQVQSVPQGR